MTDIAAFLAEHGIAYERFEHPAVFTCEEAERLCPPMPGAHTKNLFLRDKAGKRHFLVVLGYDRRADLKALAGILGASGLSFASPERLLARLGVTPGSVTLLGLANDAERAVELFVEESVWAAEAMLCHPLVNTATLSIPHAGIERFLSATGHEARVFRLPG